MECVVRYNSPNPNAETRVNLDPQGLGSFPLFKAGVEVRMDLTPEQVKILKADTFTVTQAPAAGADKAVKASEPEGAVGSGEKKTTKGKAKNFAAK